MKIGSGAEEFCQCFWGCVRFRHILEASIKIFLCIENPQLFKLIISNSQKFPLNALIEFLLPDASWSRRGKPTSVRKSGYLSQILREAPHQSDHHSVTSFQQLRKDLNPIVHPGDDSRQYHSLTEEEHDIKVSKEIAEKCLSRTLHLLFILTSYLYLVSSTGNLTQIERRLKDSKELELHLAWKTSLQIFLEHEILLPPALNSKGSATLTILGSSHHLSQLPPILLPSLLPSLPPPLLISFPQLPPPPLPSQSSKSVSDPSKPDRRWKRPKRRASNN